MDDTAPAGFVTRNNQVIGSILSVIALLVAVLLGAGLMFGTGTRGVRAILTVITVAGGTFTLLLIAIGATLRAVVPESQWEMEEAEWRHDMGLTADDVPAEPTTLRRLTVPLAVLAVLVGLSLSALPATL